MAFWVHDIYELTDSMTGRGRFIRGRFTIVEDVLSTFALGCFSIIQAQIALRLIRRLTRTRLRHVFALVSIALCAGYIISTILWTTGFCLKLWSISRIYQDGRKMEPFCVDGYEAFCHPLCQPENSRQFRLENSLYILDKTVVSCVQLLLVLADGLLIYRCYVMLECGSALVITTAAGSLLLFSVGAFIVVLKLPSRPYNPIVDMASTWISLGFNLLISPTLIIHLWREKKEVDALVGDSRVGKAYVQYTRIIRTLVESAVPPLILGLALVISRFYGNAAPALYLVWVTFTILAPQTIAMRVLRRRDSRVVEASSTHVPMTSIAFRVTQTTATSNADEEFAVPTEEVRLSPASRKKDHPSIVIGGNV
ncbi:hypothetical protein BKA70DRAFT_1481778 [Coprinopsis sp. MPI-PUGE-AT-0042]|nr:hypothetical protein BKA70DRAFT_1481778 [Coprinopsis sp. MPI-PUGE-AT-0042]